MDENSQTTMQTGCLSWLSSSFSRKLKLRTRKNQLLTSGNPSFEHLRKQTKSVFLFPREDFDFQSWDTVNFSTGYIHPKIINDFDKNIFPLWTQGKALQLSTHFEDSAQAKCIFILETHLFCLSRLSARPTFYLTRHYASASSVNWSF